MSHEDEDDLTGPSCRGDDARHAWSEGKRFGSFPDAAAASVGHLAIRSCVLAAGAAGWFELRSDRL